MNAFCAATTRVFNWLRGISPAFILAELQNGITLYKVHNGPTPDANHVDALTAELGNLVYPNAQVVIP